MTANRSLRIIAAFEAMKGVVVLVAATGLLSLIHHDVHAVAVALVAHAHLNPASKYPEVLLNAAAHVQDGQLLLLAAGATAYALMRFVEAWGLYAGRAWAELLAAVSGAIYVPFEIAGLLEAASWHGAALLVLNCAAVFVTLCALLKRRADRCVTRG